MKFIFSPIFHALPLIAQACVMDVQWTKNWREAGLRRYQVKLTTAPRNDSHLEIYGYGVNAAVGFFTIHNVQYYWGGNGDFVLDASFSDGPAGHDEYLTAHQYAASRYRGITDCMTNLQL